ncbi:hypothetical protein CY34DRAFT_19995 [Suillus luteus UH-Slu-Lm8-n1]|uniref:Uncharacterized protein n=1 Tax=Suillus luteus UH-Slu-Lm8-n1 TaxID=930992 RepID=A0A0D0AAV8_9AGAM|nr:hypothetical protein CY34DRAFT_19995 [Suillus luteus UH-Slu-Lm8-n1]
MYLDTSRHLAARLARSGPARKQYSTSNSFKHGKIAESTVETSRAESTLLRRIPNQVL